MSIASAIDSERSHKKLFHYRNDSGELDVFEAARYFSGYNEAVGYNGSGFTQKIMREDRHGHRGRISLDMPMRSLLPQHFHGLEKHGKEKKHKQPSSPGGRLASFLNSLFSQSASKKKKSKSSKQSMKDEDESPGGRRWRRSSISHFRSSSTADSKSLYSSFSSGFRTPPYVQTPTKSCKEFRTFLDQKQQPVPVSKYNNGHVKSTSLQNVSLWDDKKKKDHQPTVLDDNCKTRNVLSEKDRIWVEKHCPEEKEFKKFNEVDDGAESDSSSDL
ncbi:protein BIG GRAIN 1-like E, partial [Neltuma alba]